MRALLALIALAGVVLALPARAASPMGPRIVTIEAFESKHVPPRRVDVWLPPGYDAASGVRYRVLYMHDGQNLFDPKTAMGGETWGVGEAVARLMAQRKIAPTIIVGIWNTKNRYGEYAPQQAFDRFPPEARAQIARGANAELKADDYLRMITEELKPEIDRRYRTVPRPEGTVIMGSSMGGLISAYALARYPQVFGGAGCLSIHSPIVNPDPAASQGVPVEVIAASFRDWLAANLPKPPGAHRLYMDRGDQKLDSFYPPYQDKLDAAVRGAGWGDANFMSRVFPGTEHNEAAWRGRIDVPLLFLLAP